MSGPESLRIDVETRSTPRAQHLPPRFVDLERRVKASRFGRTDPVYVGGYRVLDLLGAGGFGLVFLVVDEGLDRPVALKLCPVQCEAGAEFVLLEARVLAMLTHPNIVTVYTLGQHEGDFFYTMEFIRGHDGTALLDTWTDWREVVRAYEGAAAGLAAAHKRQIVHGDFKPANVLFGPDGRVCVADFGLAHVLDDQGADNDSVTSHRNGTLPYMAPELLMGKPATHASDQWAFCVSLWETLYAERPFEGTTVAALIDSIEAGPQPKSGLVPPSVRAVMCKGLSIDPSARYRNMSALIDALQRTRSPAIARAKRRTWLAFAGGVASGVLLAAYGLAPLVAVEPAPIEQPTQAEPAPPEEEPPVAKEPESPCVLDGRSPAKLPEPLVAACKLIRENKIIAAHDKWTGERDDRVARIEGLALPDAAKKEALQAELTADSGIISRTFQDQASRLTDNNPGLAALANGFANYWMTGAAHVTKQD